MTLTQQAPRLPAAPKPLPPCPRCGGEVVPTPAAGDRDLLSCARCPWTLPEHDPIEPEEPPPCPSCGGERVVFANPCGRPELVCTEGCPAPRVRSRAATSPILRRTLVRAVASYGRGVKGAVLVKAIRQYGLSRSLVTVRRALAELVREGRLENGRGSDGYQLSPDLFSDGGGI